MHMIDYDTWNEIYLMDKQEEPESPQGAVRRLAKKGCQT